VIMSDLCSCNTVKICALQVNLAASQERCAEKEAKINECEATITAKLAEIEEANVKIRRDETVRRKLHNTVLELKVCLECLLLLCH